MKLITALILMSPLFLTSCGSGEKKSGLQPAPVAATESTPPEAAQPPQMTEAQVGQIISDWPSGHKVIVRNLISKYGPPGQSTPEMLIWENNGQWERTVVRKNNREAPLEQTAFLNVPPEKMGEIALFNRGVVVNPNRGVVTSSASREEINFLTLNLTQQIVDGGMSPMEARRQYADVSDVSQKGSFMERLRFVGEGTEQDTSLEAEETKEGQEDF